MIHLSARIAWHDNGWDGCICQEPHYNSSCIVQENIWDEPHVHESGAVEYCAGFPGSISPRGKDGGA